MNLNRRNFFRALGSAVLGTAIALRLPDALVPVPQIPDFRRMVVLWEGVINVPSPRWSKMIYGIDC